MSGIYAVIRAGDSGDTSLPSAAETLRRGLEPYGLGGAADPCAGEESYSSPGYRAVLGSVQNNAHVGVPFTPCVIESEEHLAVCDAMIYNRESFPGEELTSDGELLVKVYEKEGLPGLRSLSADFAAVLIEKKGGKIVLLRDHMGIRPLYVLKTADSVVVSTDYRPFFELPDHGITINGKYLYEYLIMGLTSSPTEILYSNISKAQAGSVTELSPDRGVLSSVRYWTPGQRKVPKVKPDVRYEKAYARLIRDAVRRRAEAVGGKAIGAEFSGGLDSGIVVSLLDEYASETGTDLPNLATWSPSAEDYPIREKRDEVIRDEREIIQRFCEEKGNTILYRPRRDSEDVSKYIRNLERRDIAEYDADVVSYTTEALGKYGIKTVFSGWGGDEAVTMRFGPSQLLEDGEYRAFLHEAVHAAGGRPRKFLGYIKRALLAMRDIHRPWDGIELNGLEFSIARDDFAAGMQKTRGKKYAYFGWDPVRNLLSGGLESRTLLAASAGADAGMVYMFPLLDPLLIDYALSVPRRLFMKDGIRRLLPQRALRDIVPDYLTRFSGESNVEKLDTGRMDLYYEVAEKTQHEADEMILERLDRNLFKEYVDFDKLERYLRGSEDPYERNALREIARTLYKVQLLLQGNK